MTDLVNPARGTVEIPFDGKIFVCRPTFDVVAAIENATGKSIFQVGSEISAIQASLTTIAVVLTNALKTSSEGKKLTVKDVGEILVRKGVGSVIGPLSKFCLQSFAGEPADDEPEEKIDPLT